jgi:hypothetical protein
VPGQGVVFGVLLGRGAVFWAADPGAGVAIPGAVTRVSETGRMVCRVGGGTTQHQVLLPGRRGL